MQSNEQGEVKSTSLTTSDSTVESVNEFVQTVVDGFNEVGASEEVVDEIEQKGEQLTEEVSQLVEQVGDNSNEINNNSDELSETRRQQAEDRQRIHDVEQSVEDVDIDETPTPNTDTTSTHEPVTSLEEVVTLSETIAEDSLTSNQQRSRFIAKNVEDYTRSVPAGRAIKSSEIRRVLSASEDTSVHTETVSRTMDFLDRLGDDDVSIKETQSNEKVVVFTDEIVDRIVSLRSDNHTVVADTHQEVSSKS